jgi:hypothetical protein
MIVLISFAVMFIFALLTILFVHLCKKSIKYSYFWNILSFVTFVITVISGLAAIISTLILLIK